MLKREPWPVVGLAVGLAGCSASPGDGPSFADDAPSTTAMVSGGSAGDGASTGDGQGSTGGDTSPGTGDSTGEAGECPCADPLQFCQQDLCVAIETPEPGAVIFTELHPDPASVSDFVGEWFELTNVGTVPVNLSGCALMDEGRNDDDHVIATGTAIIVEPGLRVVMAKTTDGAENGGLTTVAYGFGDNFSLSNSPSDVALLECDGDLIDRVAYDETWPFAAGTAVQLSASALGGIENDVAANWCAAVSPYGTGDLGTPLGPNAECN